MRRLLARAIQATTLVASVLMLVAGARQMPRLTVARLHYDGGGDWYANPSSLPNLLAAIRERSKLGIAIAAIIKIIATTIKSSINEKPFCLLGMYSPSFCRLQ